MMTLTRNQRLFTAFLVVFTVLFRYFLSSFLRAERFTEVWIPSVIYMIAILSTAWPLGATDPVRASRRHLAFYYHLITYVVCNGIALFWHAAGFSSEYESISPVLITIAVWAVFLFGHYLYSRRTIKGFRRDEMFD